MDLAMDFLIRPLTSADGEAWRVLRMEALKDQPAAFTASYEDALELDPAELAAFIPAEDAPSVLFGLFVDGALEGCAGLFIGSGSKVRHKGLLWGVYVRPGWQGRGFGRALVARVIEEARGKVDLLQAGVAAINDAARRVYFGLGFQLYGLERAALRVDGADIDEELLWIDLRNGADSLPAAPISDRRAP